jgi:hypothetical protein
MRIKFNDKIYRLKEVESGVDSLMELVEEQKYKNGDFVYEDGRIMIVKSYPNLHHANVWPIYSDMLSYDGTYAVDFSEPTFRYATEEEKQLLIDAMKKDGKRWNAEMKCIEDIPKPKFKVGDKVRIKDCISNKTHERVSPGFTSTMDKFIGKELTVKEYRGGFAVISEDYCGYYFNEDWLEPYEELKKGDLVIFWDDDKRYAALRFYEKSNENEGRIWHKDIRGFIWANAIKFESKEQYEKVLRGEI